MCNVNVNRNQEINREIDGEKIECKDHDQNES